MPLPFYENQHDKMPHSGLKTLQERTKLMVWNISMKYLTKTFISTRNPIAVKGDGFDLTWRAQIKHDILQQKLAFLFFFLLYNKQIPGYTMLSHFELAIHTGHPFMLTVHCTSH